MYLIIHRATELFPFLVVLVDEGKLGRHPPFRHWAKSFTDCSARGRQLSQVLSSMSDWKSIPPLQWVTYESRMLSDALSDGWVRKALRTPRRVGQASGGKSGDRRVASGSPTLVISLACDNDWDTSSVVRLVLAIPHVFTYNSWLVDIINIFDQKMHVPVIASIAQYLLPRLTSSPPAATPGGCEILTFTPIHAHGHTSHPSSPSPVLLLHNASATQSFFSVPDTSMLSIDESSEVLLDHPRADIASAPLSIRTKTIQIRRPRVRPPSMLSWAHSARRSRLGGTDRLPSPFPLPASPYGEVGAAATNASEVETWVAPDYNDHHGEWEDVEVRAPDVSDRQTLITLAKMTSNAYVSPDSGEWWPVKGWNSSVPFGWEPDADGLRGHVVSPPAVVLLLHLLV